MSKLSSLALKKRNLWTNFNVMLFFLAKLHIMDYSLLVGIHNKLAAPNSDRIATLTGQSSRVLGLERMHSRKVSQGEAFPPRGTPTSSGQGSVGFKDMGSPAHSPLTEQHILEEVEEDEELDDGGVGVGEDDDMTDLSYTELDDPPPPDSIFSPVEAVDAQGRPGTEIYYFGIIDILQLYNARKRTENILKSIVEGGESGISAVSPQRYASRFVKFVDAHVE
mmetsp:Transcript_5804/g.11915  ORF Transcript_5804/g.11915 Transcript_5804/m.11915 type:complete len:222 (-) Transcript_5804:115-780(-)